MGKRDLAGRRGLRRNGMGLRRPGTWGPAERSKGEAGLGRREVGSAGAMAAISREHGRRVSTEQRGFWVDTGFCVGEPAGIAVM